MKFKDGVAVLTAAGNGIGRACAVALAREGMHVVVADIDQKAANETAELVRSQGVSAVAVHCDVSKGSDVAALLDRVDDEFGRVDLLHNHAGIAVGGQIEQIPLAEWTRVLEINVVSQVRGVNAFLPRLTESGGHVVNTTSSLGVLGNHPMAALAGPYVTSKAAIVGLTQVMASALRPRGVGVSLLAPDNTSTNFVGSFKFYGLDGGLPAPSPESEDAPPVLVQTPELVAEVYVESLRRGDFLISSTPDIDQQLAHRASVRLDPGL